MKKHNWKQIIQEIKRSTNILISTHINPDGDGLGSEAALYRYLKKMDKNPIILNSSSFVKEYAFLNEDEIFNQYDKVQHKKLLRGIDLIIILDVSSISRLGKIWHDLVPLDVNMICIDHHPPKVTTVMKESSRDSFGGSFRANDGNFFNISVIDETASATACLIYELIKEISPELMDVKIAEALYAGVMTDTGSFRFENTTTNAMEMAIEMMNYGVKPSVVYRDVYENKKPAQMKLLGLALQEVKFEEDGKLAWFSITQEQIKSCGAVTEDVDGFTDYVRSINGIEVVVMFLEVNKKCVRMNFRSKGKVIVNRIAEKYNGGGHKFAAGAITKLTLDETIKQVLPYVRNAIRNIVSK